MKIYEIIRHKDDIHRYSLIIEKQKIYFGVEFNGLGIFIDAFNSDLTYNKQISLIYNESNYHTNYINILTSDFFRAFQNRGNPKKPHIYLTHPKLHSVIKKIGIEID